VFRYDFEESRLNFARIFGTKSYVLGMIFTEYFIDKRVKFNGTEWTTIFFFDELQRIENEEYADD
jgi:hypothetical protein